MSEKYSVVVVGIGAMGGGMARALLDPPPGSDEIIECVIGYDRYRPAVDKFFEEAKQANKTSDRFTILYTKRCHFIRTY